MKPSLARPSALEAALLDHSPSVREFARFHLRQLGRNDFAPFYRMALADARRRAAAIAGLGETGDREDAQRLAPYLQSPSAADRQAAVRAVGKLAGEEYRQLLAACLDDDSPRVAREVRRVLENHEGALEAARLWEIFSFDKRRHVRLAALALLEKLETWQRLPYLIRAAAHADAAVARQARHYIERRYNKVFTKPKGEERRRIEEALGACAASLGEAFNKRLRFGLRL